MSDYTAFYAIRDPHDPDRFTYWRRHKVTGELAPWPPNTKTGPRPTPNELGVTSRGEWNRLPSVERRDRFAALNRRRLEYHEAVAAAVAADAVSAQARFVAFCTRCAVCGRRLTDPKSKTSGIGPECRQGEPDAYLASLAEAVGRAHAEHIAADTGGAA